MLVHHPYDSFLPVEKFVESASEDERVAGLKMTLYRVGSRSPIVGSLLDAAEQGKQVAAMVELKARFDESNNLVWSRALEQAGVHVTYGFKDKKVHCKLCLVVRQEADGLRTYAHIGTGNYNPDTARSYTCLLYTSPDRRATPALRPGRQAGPARTSRRTRGRRRVRHGQGGPERPIPERLRPWTRPGQP